MEGKETRKGVAGEQVGGGGAERGMWAHNCCSAVIAPNAEGMLPES